MRGNRVDYMCMSTHELSRTGFRTCIGCHAVVAQTDLLRIVADSDGIARPDPKRSSPGRGAWIHPRSECMEQAAQRSQFSRAFKRHITDVEKVNAWIQAQLSVKLNALRSDNNPSESG